MPRMSCPQDRLQAGDWLGAALVALVVGALSFFSRASCAFPGESARLIAQLRGLDVAGPAATPLLELFAKACGGGNAIAPVCGTFAAVAIYLLTAAFVRARLTNEERAAFVTPTARLAAAVAAALFALSPAVLAASTHLESRLFALAWMLFALLCVLPWRHAPKQIAWLCPLALGALWGLGLVETPLFAVSFALPFVLVWTVPLKRGARPYVSVILFLSAFLVVFFSFASAAGGVSETLKTLVAGVRAYVRPAEWPLVLLFAVVPFVAALFAASKGYNGKGGRGALYFHLGLSVLVILAVAPSRAPSALMARYAILPVVACACAAAAGGYLLSYWRLALWVGSGRSRPYALVSFAVLACVFGVTVVFSFVRFDGKAGAFADRMAEKVLDDLGTRRLVVSDGMLDSHLRLVAAARGKTLEIVDLRRDNDPAYLKRLSARVLETKLGGARCRDLALSLKLGVLPFVQDLLALPDATNEVVVCASSDLWYAAGRTPVPEFAFFGGDPAREWRDAWDVFADLLKAPRNWGSFRLHRCDDSLERFRLELRRRLGMIANNRAVWLMDRGRDDEAYELLTRVQEEIDTDNVSALFNLSLLAQKGNARAAAKRFTYESRIKKLSRDPDRRYRLWSLSNYYGYIRDPDVFVRLGFAWARSGRPGEALAHMRRAEDFVSDASRASFMNMLASLYAAEDARAESRAYYAKVLAKNRADREALLGMMRLSLVEGDVAGAAKYIEQAVAAGGDDPRVQVERAVAATLRGDMSGARDILKKTVEESPKDLRAWSLYATVVGRLADTEQDPAKKAALEKLIDMTILPAIRKNAPSARDYNVLVIEGSLALRRGAAGRRAARDAFAEAAELRPDVLRTHEIVLGLDVALNDPDAAARHAKAILRRSRNQPMANYVMGSLALRDGDLDAAEGFLRRAADAERPVPAALNDLAEVYRRTNRLTDAESYARKAVAASPKLYAVWETLGSILVERKGDLAEAERCIEKACALSTTGGTVSDARMLVALARVQAARGDALRARGTLARAKAHAGFKTLTDFERQEYEKIAQDVR